MVKVFGVFLLLATVSAVPVKQETSFKEIRQEFLMRQARESLRVTKDQPRAFKQLEILEEPPAEELNVVNFRLPNNTIPLSYNVTITTNIHAGNFLFEGETLINIKVLETSNTITLHASQMIVNRIDLHAADLTRIDVLLDFRMDSVTQFLEVSLRQPIQGDQEIFLFISHTGSLRNDRLGFYRASVIEGNEQRWVASTLFEPTHARHAFPCYDEIRYRTPFNIRIIHHSSFHALSNMPISETRAGTTMTTTVFETTPPMPTYNVAFTISDYEFVSNNNETLPMRVYARARDIEAGRADGALELGERMWGTLVDIFEVPYPLPKCDIFAVNNWRNGESWGLLKIDDWSLLSNIDIEDSRSRRLQIAHELTVSLKFFWKLPEMKFTDTD